MTAEQVGLFGVDEIAPLANARRTEAGLMAALRKAESEGIVTELDAGLIGGALVAARALDRAEAMTDKTAVYAIAQLLPPFQRAVHGLRLPLEVAPVSDKPLPAGPAGVPSSWLDDLGTAR